MLQLTKWRLFYCKNQRVTCLKRRYFVINKNFKIILESAISLVSSDFCVNLTTFEKILIAQISQLSRFVRVITGRYVSSIIFKSSQFTSDRFVALE